MKLAIAFHNFANTPKENNCRFLWPRDLRRMSVAVRLLGLRVQFSPGLCLSVCCECYVIR
jgi:hypothetical protein